MRYCLAILCVLSLQRVSLAQSGELSDTQGAIRSQAAIMVQAYENGQYDLLLNYTYPQVIAMSGGREVLQDMIAQMMANLSASGVHIDSIRVGDPGQIYAAGTEWHAIIPQQMTMSTADSAFISETYLLAISQDKGARWYFIDTTQLTPEILHTLFPNYNTDLIIPEPKQTAIRK